METLRLHWLGTPLVELKGRAVKFETRKAIALLAYASLHVGECSREQLATLFWPEKNQQKALGNLRRTLSSLHASLPGWIQAGRETICLDGSHLFWTDVNAFRQAIIQPIEPVPSENEVSDERLAGLIQALGYHRGDFLEGLNLDDCPGFDEWQSFQRDGLRQELAGLLERLSAAYAARGEWEQAIPVARRWAALDRLYEPACRNLMDLYARSNQRAMAIRQYEELARSLREQMGQEPEAQTRQLFERIGGRAETKSAESASPLSSPLPLLKTKLYIPTVPASRVVRSQLINLLGQLEHKPLTLISAPAGFGKTTLLAEWIAQSSLPTAWLSLDHGDNDPNRFLAYLIAALESLDEGLGIEAQQLLQSLQPVPPHVILASLINDLSKIRQPCVLALDDYQFITEPAVQETVGYLLDHLPPNLHLVISTRADPYLQLGRMRAHGQMLELRTQDLRFTPSEASQFLNDVMRLGLSPEGIEALQARTEGWVVGLQMAALSLKGHENANAFIQAFSGSQRYVLDYLVEEVMKRQPAHIQTFLLNTSILDKLSGPLCGALMSEEWRQAGESGQTVLEYLERSNLFVIPLDDHKEWYRYHHLFADLLRSRLIQSSADLLSALHGRASYWYENNGFPVEAIQHAFAARNTEEATGLIERHAGDILFAGGYTTVLQWIQGLPPRDIERHPWLCVWLAWGILASGKVEGVGKLIEDAKKGLAEIQEEQPGAVLPENERLTNEILTLEVSLASLLRDHSKTIKLALQVLERISDVNSRHHINALYPLGNAYYITGDLIKAEQTYREVRRLSEQTGYLMRHILATHKLACIQQVRGNLRASYNLYEELLGLVEKYGKQEVFGMGYVYAGLGRLYYEWNHLEGAWQMMARGLKLDEMTQVPMILVDGYNDIVSVLMARGELQAGEEMLGKAARLIKEYPVLPETKEMFESCRVKLWLAQDDIKSASTWGQERLSQGFEAPAFERELGDIALARVLIAAADLDGASGLLSRLASSAEAGGRNGRLIEILLLKTRILLIQNQREQALRTLELGVRAGKPGNYIRTYVDEGIWLEELLRLEVQRGSFKEPLICAYLQRILAALSENTEGVAARMIA